MEINFVNILIKDFTFRAFIKYKMYRTLINKIFNIIWEIYLFQRFIFLRINVVD
jgi:hypothetical protein